jgi:hypothetical protein
MASATTGAVKARPQTNARFQVACDGVYFEESGARVSKRPGTEAGERGALACNSRPNSWVNRPNWRFGTTAQADCGNSYSLRNAPADKWSLHTCIIAV